MATHVQQDRRERTGSSDAAVRGLRAAEPSLAPLERQAVYLSLQDDRSSIVPRRGLPRLVQALVAPHARNPLADRRLEALRRYAVFYRLMGRVSGSKEEAALIEAGFTDAQVERVERLVDGARLRRRGEGAWVRVAVLVVVAAMVVLGIWLAGALDDPVAAVLVLGTAAVSALSMRAGRRE